MPEETAQGGRGREGGGRKRFFLGFAPAPWAYHPKLPPMKRGGQDMASWGPRAQTPWVDTGEGLVVVYL